MPKTVHVIPKDGQWAVKREAGAPVRLFSTQRDAIKTAKVMVRQKNAGQVVVHGRDGQIKEHDTYGMPPIQEPPGKKSAKKRIERAVAKMTRERLLAEPLPLRG